MKIATYELNIHELNDVSHLTLGSLAATTKTLVAEYACPDRIDLCTASESPALDFIMLGMPPSMQSEIPFLGAYRFMDEEDNFYNIEAAVPGTGTGEDGGAFPALYGVKYTYDPQLDTKLDLNSGIRLLAGKMTCWAGINPEGEPTRYEYDAGDLTGEVIVRGLVLSMEALLDRTNMPDGLSWNHTSYLTPNP